MNRSSMRLFVAVAIVALPSLALADTIIFAAPDITLTENPSVAQTGYFDVVAYNSADSNTTGGAGDNDPNDPYGPANGVTNTTGVDDTTAVQAKVTTAGGPGGAVTFIAADESTSAGGAANANPATYIYVADPFSSPTSVSAQDAYMEGFPSSDPNNVGLSPVGLLRVEYNIPAGFTGTADLTIVTIATDAGNGSSWLDSQYNTNEPLTVNGSITVNPIPSPEPSSLVLLVIGAVGLFGVRRLRSR